MKNGIIRYILVDGVVTPEPDLRAWGDWMGDNSEQRQIDIANIGEVVVSTVFFGLDSRYSTYGKPTLWETMIFDDKNTKEGDSYDCERYSSLEAAKLGHHKAVLHAFDKMELRND